MARGYHAIVLGLLAAHVVQLCLNWRAIPRLSGRGRHRAPAAVLIPARDEADAIAASIAAWARQDYPDFEVIVLDDDSSDGTADVARAAAAPFRHVRVVREAGVPPGWCGKTWACHRLRAHTRADVLVFADADVVPAPHVLGDLVDTLVELGASLVSVLPSHANRRPLVQAVLGLQNWAAMALVPAWLGRLRPVPLTTATNGQLFAVRASAYDAAGGFAAVRGTVAEDAALGRRLARLGHVVRLVDGGTHVTCRREAGLAAVWRGNVRNLHGVLWSSPALAVGGAIALAAAIVAPACRVAVHALRGTRTAATWVSLAEVALACGARLMSDRRADYPRWLFLLHPVAVAVLAGMLLDSTFRAATGARVEWRGRRYPVADDSRP